MVRHARRRRTDPWVGVWMAYQVTAAGGASFYAIEGYPQAALICAGLWVWGAVASFRAWVSFDDG